MGLVIHDLCKEDWLKLSGGYEGWSVVSDNGKIRPCIGCFSCWNKDPGRCAIRDGYEDMGLLIHYADDVVVISRYTYGGFSGFVKNVFDRCLAYVLPQFEIIKGETHHKKRYDEDKPFTFIFYGDDLSSEEKASAVRYAEAVCANIRGHVKDVTFRERKDVVSDDPDEKVTADSIAPESASTGDVPAGKVVLLNGSMRYVKGNSAILSRKLEGMLSRKSETVALMRHVGSGADPLRILEGATDIVLCVPLYVDGLPSQVIRFMEAVRDGYRGASKRIYVLANMGLYESSQLANLFAAVKQWCVAMGFEYCGGLGVSAGELVGVLIRMLPFGIGPTKAIAKGMKKLAAGINSRRRLGDIYAEPHRFPRSLYISIANNNWTVTARKNGIKPRDLYRQL